MPNITFFSCFLNLILSFKTYERLKDEMNFVLVRKIIKDMQLYGFYSIKTKASTKMIIILKNKRSETIKEPQSLPNFA